MKYRNKMQILSDRIQTPIGDMTLLAADGVLLLLEFVDAEGRVEREISARFSNAEIIPANNPFGFSQRITDYFRGDLHTINDIPTDGGGTEFQRRVWAGLRQIPCGVTISYGELAMRLGDRNAMRAVGLANGRNSISIVVPCHRVTGANGAMTGYGDGMARKEWLLRREGALLI